MAKAIATIAVTKDILDRYDLYPKKSYGQNFIIEPRIVEKIADNSHLDKHTAVIEIGPGIGALTEQLALRAKTVLAFEIDRQLIAVLQETLAAYPNVQIENADFMTCDLDQHYERLLKDHDRIVITANLPYYLTTPMIFKIIESRRDFPYLTFMVQKELAERFRAQPNTKEYNALSVVLQYLYDIEIIMKVTPTVFIPQPAVDSIVVQFHQKDGVAREAITEFSRFVKDCFGQRRKTIYNNLKNYCCDTIRANAILLAAGIDPGRRAESLTVAEFIRLYGAAHES